MRLIGSCMCNWIQIGFLPRRQGLGMCRTDARRAVVQALVSG